MSGRKIYLVTEFRPPYTNRITRRVNLPNGTEVNLLRRDVFERAVRAAMAKEPDDAPSAPAKLPILSRS